jgi:nicotinamidase-related amidase
MCVSAIARSALQRGIAVVLAHDAHAAYDIPGSSANNHVIAEAAGQLVAPSPAPVSAS